MLHAEQTKTRFFAEDVFVAKIFSDAHFWQKMSFLMKFGETNMSFLVEFEKIQYVVLQGILHKIKN